MIGAIHQIIEHKIELGRVPQAQPPPSFAAQKSTGAIQARRQELTDQAAADMERVELRKQTAEEFKALSGAAQDSGVQSTMFGVFHDAGYKGFVVEPWFGFMVPRGTPQQVVDRLNAAFNAALANQRVRKRLEEAGLRPVGGTAAVLGEQIRVETERWAKVIKANNIKAE